MTDPWLTQRPSSSQAALCPPRYPGLVSPAASYTTGRQNPKSARRATYLPRTYCWISDLKLKRNFPMKAMWPVLDWVPKLADLKAVRSRGGQSLSLLRFLKSSTTLDHKPNHCQTRRAKWVHRKLGMRPAWVQSQVRPTLEDSYGLHSLSKNLMEKEEGGWRKSFYSQSAHPPCSSVRNQISPSPFRKKWRERNGEP